MKDDELRTKIQDAIFPPSEHPTFGTMRLGDETGLFRTGELQITGNFSGAIDRLVELFNKYMSEAERTILLKSSEIMKDILQENFMYRTLYGEIKHPDGKTDVPELLKEYMELEPERKKFAQFLEQRLNDYIKQGQSK